MLFQIIAALGPIALAIMGAWVSIKAPSLTGRAHKVWAAAFVLVGIITASSNFIELRGTDQILDRIWDKVGQSIETNHASKPNKYICVTGSKIAANKYGMVVEFGVLNYATDGQSVGALLGSNYEDVKYWFGPPLRTDLTPFSGNVGLLMSVQANRKPNSLAMTMTTPSISPDRSFYMVFSGSTPLYLAQKLFIENAQITAVSDPSKFQESLKQPFADCPRDRH